MLNVVSNFFTKGYKKETIDLLLKNGTYSDEYLKKILSSDKNEDIIDSLLRNGTFKKENIEVLGLKDYNETLKIIGRNGGIMLHKYSGFGKIIYFSKKESGEYCVSLICQDKETLIKKVGNKVKDRFATALDF